MLWDTHMHTHHSGDSEASPAAMIETAIRKGLVGLCFTDHYDYDYPNDPGLFLLDFEAYEQEIATLCRQYADRFPVRWGVEIGLQPQLASHNRTITQSHPFDFVIGSSHVVHGVDPYYPSYYEGRGTDAAYREYFESILENLHTDADFDVYGHLDYVVRYGPDQNKDYSYQEYSDLIDEILRILIDQGKGIELNTGGFRHGLGHPNPTEDILARYRELGGEIITVGADAHTPNDIGIYFERVPSILRAAGFTHYTVFEGRRPRFLPIESA